MNHAPLSDLLIHQVIEKHAQFSETAGRIYFGNASINYAELNAKSNQLARYLQRQKLTAEGIVGVFLPPSLELLIAIIAISKCGLTYLPITTHRDESVSRLNDIIQQAKPDCLLVTEKVQTHPLLLQQSLAKTPFINLTELNPYLEQQSSQNLNLEIPLTRRAYLIYTSGSTGKPNGVEIEHRGIVNNAKGFGDLMALNANDHYVMSASIGFDSHLLEAYVALYRGANLSLLSGSAQNDLSALIDYYNIPGQAVTAATFIPSMLRRLNPEDFPHLRIIVSTGEDVDKGTLHRWRYQGRDSQSPRLIINGHGPTENTIVFARLCCNNKGCV